jgi:cytochrome P450 family 9
MAPVLLQTLSFPDFLSDIYNRLKGHKYGGVYQLMNPVLLLRDPELIKMVTVKDFEHFLDRQFLISEDVEPLFGKALFFLKGEQLTACTVLTECIVLTAIQQAQKFFKNTVAELASD